MKHLTQYGIHNFFYRKLKPNKKYLVALSGGPDSIALLHIAKQFNINIVAVHVNHNIREESKFEESFCKSFCKSLNIPFYSKKLNKEDIENGNQEVYRELRYSYFEDIYKKENADGLLIAHHKNDQAETIFMNIFKSSNIFGLMGIKPYIKNYNMKIYRPLLEMTKNDILAYIERHDLNYCIDKSNLKTDYTRNKVRLDILPTIEESLRTNATDSLVHLGKTMNEVEDLLNFYSEDLRSKLYINRLSEYMSINLSDLKKHHPFLIKDFLYKLIKEELDCKLISLKTIDDILNIIKKEKGTVHIKNLHTIKVFNDKLYIYEKEQQIEHIESKELLQFNQEYIIGNNVYTFYKSNDLNKDLNCIYVSDTEDLYLERYNKHLEFITSKNTVKQLLKESNYFKDTSNLICLTNNNNFCYKVLNLKTPIIKFANCREIYYKKKSLSE